MVPVVHLELTILERLPGTARLSAGMNIGRIHIVQRLQRVVLPHHMDCRHTLDHNRGEPFDEDRDFVGIMRPIMRRRCSAAPAVGPEPRRVARAHRGRAEASEGPEDRHAGALNGILSGKPGLFCASAKLITCEWRQPDTPLKLHRILGLPEDTEDVDDLAPKVVIDLRTGSRLPQQHRSAAGVRLNVDPVRRGGPGEPIRKRDFPADVAQDRTARDHAWLSASAGAGSATTKRTSSHIRIRFAVVRMRSFNQAACDCRSSPTHAIVAIPSTRETTWVRSMNVTKTDREMVRFSSSRARAHRDSSESGADPSAEFAPLPSITIGSSGPRSREGTKRYGCETAYALRTGAPPALPPDVAGATSASSTIAGGSAKSAPHR